MTGRTELERWTALRDRLRSDWEHLEHLGEAERLCAEWLCIARAVEWMRKTGVDGLTSWTLSEITWPGTAPEITASRRAALRRLRYRYWIVGERDKKELRWSLPPGRWL